MAWDASRPIPWRRLLIEWALLTAIAGPVLVALSKPEQRLANAIAVVVGGSFYVAMGAVLAKFGYQRKSLRQLRAETAAREAAKRAAAGGGSGRTSGTATGHRPGPAPTRRTTPKGTRSPGSRR